MSHHDITDPITIASVLVRDHLDTRKMTEDLTRIGHPDVPHGCRTASTNAKA